MLTALIVFVVASLLAPVLTKWLGTRVFYLLALVPTFGLVQTLAGSSEVLHGNILGESYSWVPQFGLSVSVRLDVLVPFHFWLPAAMAAPTPVSAYLHAAAMVKAAPQKFLAANERAFLTSAGKGGVFRMRQGFLLLLCRRAKPRQAHPANR